MGASNTGKTCALFSLVRAGYSLRILDLDNGLHGLIALIREYDPSLFSRVSYMTCIERFSSTGEVLGGKFAFPLAYNAMVRWDDGTTPREWGPGTVFILDTMTRLGEIAYTYDEALLSRVKEGKGGNATPHGMQVFYAAQQRVRNFLDGLLDEGFSSHVIINTHFDLTEHEDGTQRAYPSSIGAKLGPKLGARFQTVLATDKTLKGKEIHRIIRTFPTALFDLKNPAPFRLERELPQETGLATLFRELIGDPPK